jgi:hypothetical protein
MVGVMSLDPNFLQDAAQGTAVYSASLASQSTAGFPSTANSASGTLGEVNVQLTGVASQFDHGII